MLQAAIENEMDEFLDMYRTERDEKGHLLAVRNGYLPKRKILTSLGPITVKQPWVDDRTHRSHRNTETFTSRILPLYLRRIPSINNLIPALYFKGLSTRDFPRVLPAIMEDSAKTGRKFLIESLYHSILEDTPPPIPYKEILLTSRIMDSIFEQINTQK